MGERSEYGLPFTDLCQTRGLCIESHMLMYARLSVLDPSS
jgi:hypothetical protein